MTDQQPTRFENYPPETSGTPFGNPDPNPVQPPAPYMPSAPVQKPPPSYSRRGVITGLIALAIGGPVIAGLMQSRYDPSDSETVEAAEPVDEGSGENTGEDEQPTDFTVGNYTADVPSGWTLTSSDGSTAVLSRDHNQVTVMTLEPSAANPQPVDDIARAVRSADTGFSGTLGKPVNESTGSRAMATLAGKGKFAGAPAREFAELWLDDDSSYLLIVTVLTAEEGSAIARQATDVAWNLTSSLR